MNIVERIPLYIISFVLFYSSIAKLFSFSLFLQAIYKFYIPIKTPKKLVGYGIILLELILAVLLSLGLLLKFSLICGMTLFLIFTIYFIFFYFKNQKISCNCFGAQSKETNKLYAIIRNVLLIFICVLGLYFNKLTMHFLVSVHIISIHIVFLQLLIAFISISLNYSILMYKGR